MIRLILFTWVLLTCAGPVQAQNGVYTLQQCIEHAWTNLPQVKLLEQGNNITLEQLEQLRAATQPSLAFNASQNLNMGRSIDPFTYQFTNEKIFSNNFNLAANMPLFSGFKYVRSKDQQSLLVEANKENIFKVKNDVALSIANQYLQVLLLKEQGLALDTQMVQTQRQYLREQKLVEAGKSNEHKALQVKAQWLTEENRRNDIALSLKNALTSLKYAVAFKPADAFDIATPDIEPILQSPGQYTFTGVMAEAEKNQASVKYAKANEAYYLKGIDVNRSGYLPTLTVSGSLSTGYSSARTQNTLNTQLTYQPIGYLFSNPAEQVYGPVISNSVNQADYPFIKQLGDNFSQFVGLNLRVPILGNRNNRTAVNVARINYDRARTETENTLMGLQKDVETAVNAYELAKVKKDKSQEITELQNTILKNLDIYYQGGSITLFELLNQKNLLQQSTSALIQARYELVFRKVVLDYYAGKPINL